MEAGADDGRKAFGGCCDGLKEAMQGADFEPLITVDEDGVLYLSVGLVDMEENEPGMIDHPIFFCPFCGTKLQTPDEVDAKNGGNGGGDSD